MLKLYFCPRTWNAWETESAVAPRNAWTAVMFAWMRAQAALVCGYWPFGASGTALMFVYHGPTVPPTMSLR